MSHVSANLAALHGGPIGLTDPLLYHVVATRDDVWLNPGQGVVLVDASSMTVNVALPKANTVAGRAFIILKTDQTANPVTILSQDMHDRINFTQRQVQLAAPFEAVTVISDGQRWWVLSDSAASALLPPGGTGFQVLMKESSADYDAIWVTLQGLLPTGGLTHDVLQKRSNTDYDVDWATPYWQPIGPAPPLVARAGAAPEVIAPFVQPAAARAGEKAPVAAGYSIALVNPQQPASGQSIYFGDPTSGAQTVVTGTPTEVDITPQGGSTTQILPWGVHAPDLRVDAAQLRRQAVKTSLPASLNLASSTTWTTLVSLTITTSANGFVTLRGGAGLATNIPKAASARYGLRFLRDGTEVERYSVDLAAPQQDNISVPFPELVAEDAPAAGAHTYALQAMCSGGTVTSNNDTPRPVVRATEFS